MFNSDTYEMSKHHKTMLTQHRVYLLHNLWPREEMWSSLMAKGVLSQEMVDEIKASRTGNQQVGSLLDMLPARGPDAFDSFCDTLLECDHAHVAEYLRTVESTEQFREDIRKHIEMTDLSEVLLEKFVSIFKRTTPSMQRFAERKFEVLMEEQVADRQEMEDEVQRLEGQTTKLQLEVDQLHSVLESCVETSSSLAQELEESIPSKHQLAEELQQVQKLRKKVTDCKGSETSSTYYSNMETIISYIEKHIDTINNAVLAERCMNREASALRLDIKNNISLGEKMQQLMTSVADFIDDLGHQPTVPVSHIRTELQKVHKHVSDMADDFVVYENKWKSSVRQKHGLENEVTSLILNFKEIQRLEREVKEMRSHVAELTRHGQLTKKKARYNKREIDQTSLNITQKKLQLINLQKVLERRVNSADMHAHNMLKMLPDHSGPSETDSTADTISLGRYTPVIEESRGLPVMKPNGASCNPHKGQNTAQMATSSSTTEASPPEASSQSPKGTGGTCLNQRVNKCTGQSNKENTDNRLEVPSRAGMLYRSRTVLQKPKLDKTVNAGKVQTDNTAACNGHSKEQRLLVEEKKTVAHPTQGEPECEEPLGAGLRTSTDQGREPQTKVVVPSQLKLPVKRQHDSSSESDSQPSSASPSDQIWPTLHSSQPNKSPRKLENEEKEEEEEEEEEVVQETSSRESKPLEKQAVTGGKLLGEVTKSIAAAAQASTIADRSYHYGLRNKQVLVSKTHHPTGQSREEYYKYRNQIASGYGHTKTDSRGIIIDKLHRPYAAGPRGVKLEIPASAMVSPPVSQQNSVTPSGTKRAEEGGEPASPQSKRSGFRTALTTKRVEPSFKISK